MSIIREYTTHHISYCQVARHAGAERFIMLLSLFITLWNVTTLVTRHVTLLGLIQCRRQCRVIPAPHHYCKLFSLICYYCLL